LIAITPATAVNAIAIAATAISRAFIGVDRRCSMGRLSARHAIELERRHGLTDNGDRAVAPIVARIAVLEAIDAAQAHAAVGAADRSHGMQRYRVIEEKVSATLACVPHRRVRVLACAERVPHQPQAEQDQQHSEDFGRSYQRVQ
jgi:hypothetical protein